MSYLELIRQAVTEREKSIQAVHRAVAEALRAGEPVQAVAEASGYHRNHVARIARANGIPDGRTRKP